MYRYLLYLFSFITFFSASLSHIPSSFAQRPGYWQQKVDYKMDIDMDVQTNRLTGKQKITYWNHSPDTLNRVFFHLFWNAFQPGSMMDVRSRALGKIIYGISEKGDTIRDWDSRVADRIQSLKPSEIGYDSVLTISMNGRHQKLIYHETILEVPLDRPIKPHKKVSFDVNFKAQVPLQIRRSGRDNQEGVRYSMSQWYPKLAEYDESGWHIAPYIAREFYGVWGNYDVKIKIDKDYLLGGTGYLQNPQEIGYGYEKKNSKVKRPEGSKLIWHFKAPDVHDFVWAADPNFKHISAVADNKAKTRLHVIYKGDTNDEGAWYNVLTAALRVLPFIEKHFGPYPYKQYSFIQGGDGGMEYPMATLLKGPSLGTVFHEWMHSWYQMMMGTNEVEYPWFDEGFVTYAEGKVSYHYYHAFADSLFKDQPEKRKATFDRLAPLPKGLVPAYKGYFNLVESGLAEPMTTFSDHYTTNYGYGQNAYSKGAVFLEQLSYIIGQKNLDKTFLNYYKNWAFKHPKPNDFIRTAEKVSGIQLDWYKEGWLFTTKTVDYGIDTMFSESQQTKIKLRRIGEISMPIDLMVTLKDGSQQLFYIPNYSMFGEKPNELPDIKRVIHHPWPWTNPTYELSLPLHLTDLQSVEIDPSRRMADIHRENNKKTF